MITFKNVNKKYHNREVLKNINIELPRTGIIAILGPSGCGKTTLLNCLSGLLDFDGDIIIDGKSINYLSDNDKSDFRLQHFGFVFQDFKLFEFESVMDNVLFPLDTISNVSRHRKEQKCRDLIEVVGLKKNLKQPVCKLSGGEKQRVCIARALVNDPKILLCDEPTGSLDSITAEEIMKILVNVSSKSLVVMVSHDRELVERYSDKIIEMKDGEITKVFHQDKQREHIFFPVMKNIETNKRPSIPGRFLFHHSFSSIKTKKWRTMICTAVTSLGLIGVGLASSMSSSISKNIKSAYSSIISDSKIMVSKKNSETDLIGQYSGPYDEAYTLMKKYQSYVKDIGVTYYVDFESFFKDSDSLNIVNNSSKKVSVPEITTRSVNEFKWLDMEHGEIYPKNVSALGNDEIILGLNANSIYTICNGLKIERSIKSLSKYIEQNELVLCFELENTDWQYYDEQLFTVRGFILDFDSCIYHSNHQWNQFFFEELLRFPAIDNFEESTFYPWVMRKIYYFHTFGNTDDFLNAVLDDEDFSSFLLEIASTKYYPWLFHSVDVKDIDRVLFFLNTTNSISPYYSRYFLKECKNIKNPVYGSDGGYSIYPSSLMMGFSKFTYFSCSEESLDNTLDAAETLSLYGNEKSELPSGVLSGHYSKSAQNGVIFENIPKKLLIGRAPQNLDEIVISTGMCKQLIGNLEYQTHPLHLAFTSIERITGNNEVFRDFVRRKVKIVGLVESSKNVIYHNPNWTITYFQSRLGVSIYDLGINTISFDVNDKSQIDSSIRELKKAFPNYDVSNPLQDINEGVDRICLYLEIALMIFSIIAVIISTLLLTISNYLHVMENRKDVGLARCIGIKKNESKKFLYTHAFIMTSLSFLLSSVELVACSVVIAFALSSSLDSSFAYSFEPVSLLYMALLSLGISLISSLIIGQRMNSINPLEAIKY